MLISEEAYFEKQVEDFLEHHGVKGQKWGIRHPYVSKVGSVVGKGAVVVGKGVGIGAKKTYQVAKAHPKAAAASVAAGAIATKILLDKRANVKVQNLKNFAQLRSLEQKWMAVRQADLEKVILKAPKGEVGNAASRAAYEQIQKLHAGYIPRLEKIAKANGLNPKRMGLHQLMGLK